MPKHYRLTDMGIPITELTALPVEQRYFSMRAEMLRQEAGAHPEDSQERRALLGRAFRHQERAERMATIDRIEPGC